MIEIIEKQRKTNPCQLANDRHKLIKTQARRFALVLLSGFILSTFTPVSVAQIQDHSRLILPKGAIARLGKGGVTYRNRGIAFSPDGSLLTVATSIGIWLYDAETFDEIALLTGHKDEVTTVAFSPDGTKLAGRIDCGMWKQTTTRHSPR